jgi:hypothetical protein
MTNTANEPASERQQSRRAGRRATSFSRPTRAGSKTPPISRVPGQKVKKRSNLDADDGRQSLWAHNRQPPRLASRSLARDAVEMDDVNPYRSPQPWNADSPATSTVRAFRSPTTREVIGLACYSVAALLFLVAEFGVAACLFRLWYERQVPNDVVLGAFVYAMSGAGSAAAGCAIRSRRNRIALAAVTVAILIWPLVFVLPARRTCRPIVAARAALKLPRRDSYICSRPGSKGGNSG